MTAKKVPRPVYFPVAENLTKKDFPVTIEYRNGAATSGSSRNGVIGHITYVNKTVTWPSGGFAFLF